MEQEGEEMRILRWSKTVRDFISYAPGTKFKICPEQEATEEQSFFEEVLTAVRASDMDYILFERTETILEERKAR